jgi:GH35 family endo-1,4-beta-xylanase
MQRHAYGFGSAINAKTLLTEGPDADRYREVIAHDFNKVVIENHLKWYYWERKKDYGPRAVTWLREAGLDVRGHNLLWPSKNNMPESVHPLFNTPVLLHDSILDHITEEASFYRGQLIDWDVVNEPYTNNDVQKVLGDKVLAECFRTARAADPQATLYINDFAILEAGGRDYAHQDHYFKTIEAIHNAGVGLGGIGIQGHFDGNLTPVPRLGEILDRFATFGLPIQITEFDVYTLDEQLQADYTRDFMTMVFSHPSTVGILTWGFWEKVHWLPEAAIYRTDWSLRPAGQVWYDLVFQQWWTPEQQGITDARGKFSLRGFHGDYVVEVQSGNRTIMQTVRLNGPKVGAVLRLP